MIQVNSRFYLILLHPQIGPSSSKSPDCEEGSKFVFHFCCLFALVFVSFFADLSFTKIDYRCERYILKIMLGAVWFNSLFCSLRSCVFAGEYKLVPRAVSGQNILRTKRSSLLPIGEHINIQDNDKYILQMFRASNVL